MLACSGGPAYQTTRVTAHGTVRELHGRAARLSAAELVADQTGVSVSVRRDWVCTDHLGTTTEVESTHIVEPNWTPNVVAAGVLLSGIALISAGLAPTQGENWDFLVQVPVGSLLTVGGGIAVWLLPWTTEVRTTVQSVPPGWWQREQRACGSDPLVGEVLALTFADGSSRQATLDGAGHARIALDSEHLRTVLAEPVALSVGGRPLRLSRARPEQAPPQAQTPAGPP